jgi:hypothetical protein
MDPGSSSSDEAEITGMDPGPPPLMPCQSWHGSRVHLLRCGGDPGMDPVSSSSDAAPILDTSLMKLPILITMQCSPAETDLSEQNPNRAC